MIDELTQSTADLTFTMGTFPGRHLRLTVSGFTPDYRAADYQEFASEIVLPILEQFNWHHPWEPEDNRFRLCRLVFVTLNNTHLVRNLGNVTVHKSHLCPVAESGQPTTRIH